MVHDGAGTVEGAGESDLIDFAAVILESWDWPDHALNVHWLARGKQQVWFDYGALLERGWNGADLEGRLERMHITVYGKDFHVQDGAVLAYVLVDPQRVAMTRNMLSKMGVLIG